MTELAIVSQSTHDGILSMDFLREYSATVDCRTGKSSVSCQVPSELVETPANDEATLYACGDTLIPASVYCTCPCCLSQHGFEQL